MTSKEWRKLHPIRWKRHQARYRWKKRKPCKRCKKPLEGFCKGRQYHVACQKETRREDVNERNRRRLQKLAAYKLKCGCQKCGYNKHPAALDFHHIDPRLKERRVMTVTDTERKKCVILCANCHREETWQK